MIYSDPQARVAALAVAFRRDPAVVERLRMSELPELLSAALDAIPVRKRDNGPRPMWTFPRWRETCPVLHDAAIYGYWRDGMQRCNLCDTEQRERTK